MTRVRESLRPLCAVVFVVGSIGSVHASFLPPDAEVYFSTDTPSLSFNHGFRLLQPGDALTTTGTVGIGSWNLVKKFDPAGGKGASYGLDALQVFKWPSGKGRPQVFFSTNTSFYSKELGKTVSDGDLLNKQGRIVATNQQLLAAFQPSSAVGFGLDAFDILDPGTNQQIWFSTAKSFHSDKLGEDISAGDVLSNTGQVIETNKQLLQAFQPKNADVNYGLDTLYVVNSHGSTPEIWFSTTKSFYSNALKKNISAGDLLSSDGQIVATNTELMSSFGFRLPCGDVELDAFTLVRPMMSGTDSPGKTVPPGGVSTPEPVSLALITMAVPVILIRRRA